MDNFLIRIKKKEYFFDPDQKKKSIFLTWIKKKWIKKKYIFDPDQKKKEKHFSIQKKKPFTTLFDPDHSNLKPIRKKVSRFVFGNINLIN